MFVSDLMQIGVLFVLPTGTFINKILLNVALNTHNPHPFVIYLKKNVLS